MLSVAQRAIQRHTLRTPHTTIDVKRRTCSIGAPYSRGYAGRPITWGDSGHDRLCWEVYSRASSRVSVCLDPVEARKAIETEIRYARTRAGDRACEQMWAAWCDQMAAQAKANRTASDLLRYAPGRTAVRALDGRRYSADTDYLAARSVVAEAKEILAARQDRREARKIADAARTARTGRIADQVVCRKTPEATYRRLHDGLKARKYTAARVRRELKAWAAHMWLAPDAVIDLWASRDVGSFVGLIGKLGDQAKADLQQLECDATELPDRKRGKALNHHRFDASNIQSVQLLPDWSAAIITMRDFVSFGRRDHYSDQYSTTRGVSFRAYLVVRDTTTKEAHILRIPPKFGNPATKFYGTFKSAAERVKAAVAWTFSLEPAEYAPAVEA
jgi:hypothetical protein